MFKGKAVSISILVLQLEAVDVDVDVALDGDGHDVTVGQRHLDRVFAANQRRRRVGDHDHLGRRLVLIIKQVLLLLLRSSLS